MVAAAALIVVAAVVLPAAPGGYGAGRLACRLADERVTESSGVASASWSDDVIWTHNDSGDRPRFFAIETPTCTVRAVYDVAGARAVDWEDMARSETTLYLGDVGDNDAERESVTIYEVPEPVEGAPGGAVRASAARVLRYPDGAHDAESIFVDPASGRLAVVTKAAPAEAAVYLAPPDGNGEMERVAGVPVNWATGADARSDRVIVRSYVNAYEWTVRPGAELDATFGSPPEAVGLPLTGQGEAIGYSRDGSGLWTTSERRGGPGEVHFVPADDPLSQDGSEEEQTGGARWFRVGLPLGAAAVAGAVGALAWRRAAVRSRTNG
ncbi:MAG TPA: hypothetical protein VEG38_04900 [Acidimicrobiia bacterium]|nr:hypothetical protein [Acidimicrobiia bacterium]